MPNETQILMEREQGANAVVMLAMILLTLNEQRRENPGDNNKAMDNVAEVLRHQLIEHRNSAVREVLRDLRSYAGEAQLRAAIDTKLLELA
jgi:hypothetical protein